MKKARVSLDKQQDKISDLNGYVNEQINGEKVIITNGLQEESVQNFKNTITMFVALCSKVNFILGCSSPYYKEFLY
jgi:ABC-type multidrug transport system, ATPase and permease components